MIFLWSGFKFRPLLLPLNIINGRNNLGRITVFRRGGGCKRKLRLVDFKRSLVDLLGIVKRIDYDPNRNCFLALVFYEKLFLFSYIILPEGLRQGDSLFSSFSNFSYNLGNAFPLGLIIGGYPLHNIEIIPGKGGQLVRSAGMCCFIRKKFNNFCFIRIKSKTKRILKVHIFSLAVIGQVSNISFRFIRIKKAGINRLKGWRPCVRGVAMNPIDHPHGGGEGKTSGGRPSCSPWGRLTKGPKTRKYNFYSYTKDKNVLKKFLNYAF